MKKKTLKKLINQYLLDLTSFYKIQDLYIDIYGQSAEKLLDFLFHLKGQLEDYEMKTSYEERLQKQYKIVNSLKL